MIAKRKSNVLVMEDLQENKYVKDFEEIWREYPRKIGKAVALKSYLTLIKDGYSKDLIKMALEMYKEDVAEREMIFILHGSSFFSQRIHDYFDMIREIYKEAGEIK